MNAANALGVELAECQRFIREWRPKAAEHWDEVEAGLDSLDAAAPETDAVTVTHSYGSPTRREEAAGFWTWPTVVKVAGAEVGRVIPAERFGEFVVEGQIRLLDVVRSPGRHGGSLTLKLAVPEGSAVERAA
jgi:hypothetical protein